METFSSFAAWLAFYGTTLTRLVHAAWWTILCDWAGKLCLSLKGIIGPHWWLQDYWSGYSICRWPLHNISLFTSQYWRTEMVSPTTATTTTTSLPLISDSSCPLSKHINTYEHTQNTPHTRKMNGLLCLFPHLWSYLRFWLVLKCCKVRGALCVCVYLVLVGAVR